MHTLITRILATTISLFSASYFIAGFQINNSWQSYLMAGLVFIIFNAIASPIIKLLLLPINLLPLGLLRWLTNVLVLYLFDILYTGVTISGYDFPGLTSNVISLSPRHLSLFWTLVLSSFVISLTYSLVSSLFHTD